MLLRGLAAGRRGGLRGAVLLALLVAACSSAPASGAAGHAASPSPSPAASPATGSPGAPPAAVISLARSFAAQTAGGDFTAQWPELAPQAQSLWPSEGARTAMLTAKFAGAAISSISVGTPVGGITWYDPESPAISVAGTWRFPLRVSFADPAALHPPGVASLFSMTTLSITGAAAGSPRVVGEGPASLDAPLIVPASVTPRSVHVPIFMYHLVENRVPQRSAYGGDTYGWEIDKGLTTLTSQFQSEMAAAHALGATSISLQHLGDALLYGLPLPPHSFVVTFDDARLSQWVDAVPVLRRYGFTAVFFPCTDLIGGVYPPQRYMTAAQLRDLAATGFSFGDHTLTDQTALWYASASELSALTERSKSVLEALTDQPIQIIAYSAVWPSAWPQSGPGPAAEAALVRTLSGFGYLGGLQDLPFDTSLDVSTQLWQLPRVRVGLGVTTAGWLSFVQSAA